MSDENLNFNEVDETENETPVEGNVTESGNFNEIDTYETDVSDGNFNETDGNDEDLTQVLPIIIQVILLPDQLILTLPHPSLRRMAVQRSWSV